MASANLVHKNADRNDGPTGEERHCQKTKDSTLWGVRVFTDFCNEVNIPVVTASTDIPTLCQTLKRLYGGARTKKCELYQLTAFRSLRYALKRHFEETLKVDITKDRVFAEANDAFYGMENRIKAEGKGLIRHYPAVEEEDMSRLKEYFKRNMENPTPRELLEYVWFILQYYMCRLGRDGQTDLKLTSFVIRTDEQGEKSIVQNESDLTFGNGDYDELLFGGLIPAIKGDVLCPVRAFELYISKLHKDMDRLFQKPKKVVYPGEPYWFDRFPYGKTPLGAMMPTLSHNAKLSKRYTNHSLRATAIEKLIWSGINKKEVRSISQRRSDATGPENFGQSTTSVLQRKKMASILSNNIAGDNQGGGGEEEAGTLSTACSPLYKQNDNDRRTLSTQMKMNSATSTTSAMPISSSNLSPRNNADSLSSFRKLRQQQQQQPPVKSSIYFSEKRAASSDNVAFSSRTQDSPVYSRSFGVELPPAAKQCKQSWTHAISPVNNRQQQLQQRLNSLKRNSNNTFVGQRRHLMSTNDNIVLNEMQIEEQQNPSQQTTFLITDDADSFTERNVAKTIRKSLDTPTYSYVIHKHQGNMLTNMAELWKKGKFCDATIGNGTMKIMVHKIVLVALSPELLNLPNQDLNAGCFQLTFPQEIGGDALWAFAKYMYEGVVSLNIDVLEDMERISRILQLQDLQDMCQLYRSQVNLPSDTLSSSIVVKNNSSTNLPSNLNSFQPSIQSDTTSNNVSVLNLPSGNITQTISRPVQHLQILPPGQSDLEMPYSNQQLPLTDIKLSPSHDSCITISPSNSESDITILNSEVKQERLSPVNIPQYQDKDLLIALSSRQSDNQLYLHDDYSEPWQPSSSQEDSELTGPSPNKQLKPNNDLQISDPHTLIKNELDDLEKKSNDVPCEMTLVPVEDVT